jgi:quercetin dioxygenase-like cupin family protein
MTNQHERIPVAGRVIDNPISGERIVIRESGAQTGGQLLSFDLFLPPGSHVPARHVHPIQEEQFTVMAGQMRFRLGRRTILANPGDTVLVPAGKAHWFGNSGAGTAHARVEARPALRMEEAFEAAASIGTAGRVLGTRLPRLSDLALYLIEFQREMAVPDVPPFLVRTALAPFAWLGRRHRNTKPRLAR